MVFVGYISKKSDLDILSEIILFSEELKISGTVDI